MLYGGTNELLFSSADDNNNATSADNSKVCLLASTDGAWHKRASGRSYNSLSGMFLCVLLLKLPN